MARAQEKAAAWCRAAPARVAGGGAPAVPVRARAGKVVTIAPGGGERVAASAAVAGDAVIEDIAAVQPTTAKASSKGKVISTEVVPDVQPAMDAMEYVECEATVKSYPPFIEAMKRRGVDDMDLVIVDAWCVGYHGEADAPSRRLGKPVIFWRTESDSPMENGYARPVEGIHVIVDMQNNTVIEFEDRKVVPEEGPGPGSPPGSPPRPPAGDDDNNENRHRIAVLAICITYAGGMMIGMGTQSGRIFSWGRAPKAVFIVFAVLAIVSLAVSLMAATSGVAGGPSQLVVSAFCAKLASIISTALLVEFILCNIIGGRWGCLISGVPSAALIAALLVALWIWRDRAVLQAVSNCWGRIRGDRPRPRQQQREPAPGAGHLELLGTHQGSEPDLGSSKLEGSVVAS